MSIACVRLRCTLLVQQHLAADEASWRPSKPQEDAHYGKGGSVFLLLALKNSGKDVHHHTCAAILAL
jgi:hypothetical protein